ncbi:transcriptional regulator [Planktothrix paucivesiculata]|uniref:Uncharacterized protein n=1 Tax=Planktothrix paucivesiculata PCC 9631 TaxID=671071 RepID=A0A7Z9DWL7_9CYAN|nr:transcriptional regulator [Planktothrix paucivesiculata]VXD12728.1 conserved hypothetical protein [Planktothrix paucivesiculata PCC 9631]
MLNSLPYQPFLISRLQDLTYAAGYIETCLLETSPEPELLKLVLSDISEALAPQTMTPEEAKQHLAELDEVLSKTGQEAIYSLGFWLKSLGLKLSVNVYQLNSSKLDSQTPVLQELLSNPKKKDKIQNMLELSALSFSPRRRTLFV